MCGDGTRRSSRRSMGKRSQSAQSPVKDATPSNAKRRYTSPQKNRSTASHNEQCTSGPLIVEDKKLGAASTSACVTDTIFIDGTEDENCLPAIVKKRLKSHPIHRPTSTSARVLTFYPTMEEFSDFSGYIKKMEHHAAHEECGIAKIVPPKGWTPRPSKKNFHDVDDYVINSPVRENIEMVGRHGIYFKTNTVYQKTISVKDYRKKAKSQEFANPKPQLRGLELEQQYFKNIAFGQPIYGADTEGSIYDKNVNEFNMNRLGTILDEIRFDENGKERLIKGVNTVYLYFGMYKTTFPWHAEDMDLYSINYVHFGEPKYWFGIPSNSSDDFERKMASLFPDDFKACPAFLRHKSYIVNTGMMNQLDIPYGTMTQNANEFMITFPRGYHMGFNLGYNCAESTNFASDRWVDQGKNARLCKCRNDFVEIDMRPYMKKYRPHEYDRWHAYWYEERDVITSPVKKSHRNGGGSAVAVRGGRVAAAPRGRPPARGEPKTIRHSRKPETASNVSVVRSARGAFRMKAEDDTPVFDEQSIKKLRQRFLKEMGGLFSSAPFDLFAEKQFNMKMSRFAPHCQVCMFFSDPNEPMLDSIPQRSRRLLRDRCFAKESEVNSIDLYDDVLLICGNCQCTVHSACYSGEAPSDTWLCFRCRERNDMAIRVASCHLCELRGGPLLPATFGNHPTFVHVICALMNRRTSFDTYVGLTSCYIHPPPKLGPTGSVLSHLSAAYVLSQSDEREVARFECVVCGRLKEGLVRCYDCDEETEEPMLAHATCAWLVGFQFELRPFPLVAVVICPRHEAELDMNPNKPLVDDLKPCTEVLALIGDGQAQVVEEAVVVNCRLQPYVIVKFLDRSISFNTPPDDVISCSCAKCDKTNHEKGSMLVVTWTDGVKYECWYRGQTQGYEYTVQLRSGATNVVARKDLFRAEENLPSDIRKLLAKRR